MSEMMEYGGSAGIAPAHISTTSTFVNRCYRTMTGTTWGEQWSQRITKQQLASRAHMRTCASYLKERALSWLGHLARMPPGRLPRIALFAVMEDGERGRGQPPTTARRRMHGLLTRLPQDLADAKEPELRARLDTEGWIGLTDDREAWRKVVNAAAGATTPTDRELSPTECYVLGIPCHVQFREVPPPERMSTPQREVYLYLYTCNCVCICMFVVCNA